MVKFTPPPRRVDVAPGSGMGSWPPAALRNLIRDRYDVDRVDVDGPRTLTVYAPLGERIPSGDWTARRTKDGQVTLEVKHKSSRHLDGGEGPE